MGEILSALFLAILLAVILSMLVATVRTGQISVRLDAVIPDKFAVSRKKNPTIYWFTVCVQAIFAVVVLFVLEAMVAQLLRGSGGGV